MAPEDRGTGAEWAAQALEMLGQGVVLIDAQGLVRRLNPQACAMLGYAAHELLDRSCMVVAPPEIHVKADRFLAGLLKESERIAGHWVMRHKNGSYITVVARYKACTDRGFGPCVLATFALEDKTDAEHLARQAQSEREASELVQRHGLLQLLVNSVPARIAYFDSKSLRCIFGNESFAMALGRPAKTLIGKPAQDLVTATDWALLEPEYRRAAKGETLRFERTERTPEGATCHVEVDLLPHFGRSGEQIGIFSLAMDITAHREAGFALQESKARLHLALERAQQLGELKLAFVSMASHEMRTPLMMMQGSTDLLLHYAETLDSATRKEALTEIQEAIQRMVAIMENILILGRMGHGESALLSPINVQALLKKIAAEATATCQRALGIVVTPPLARNWAEDPLFDEASLRHIVGNLLSNACKYSPPDSPIELRWHKRLAQDSAELVFDVIDQGIGIPEADQPRLFEAFQRASNVGNVPGTGLGLPIVKRAIDSLGGSIEVHSRPGQGTRISVRLPWKV